MGVVRRRETAHTSRDCEPDDWVGPEKQRGSGQDARGPGQGKSYSLALAQQLFDLAVGDLQASVHAYGRAVDGEATAVGGSAGARASSQTWAIDAQLR